MLLSGNVMSCNNVKQVSVGRRGNTTTLETIGRLKGIRPVCGIDRTLSITNVKTVAVLHISQTFAFPYLNAICFMKEKY